MSRGREALPVTADQRWRRPTGCACGGLQEVSDGSRDGLPDQFAGTKESSTRWKELATCRATEELRRRWWNGLSKRRKPVHWRRSRRPGPPAQPLFGPGRRHDRGRGPRGLVSSGRCWSPWWFSRIVLRYGFGDGSMHVRREIQGTSMQRWDFMKSRRSYAPTWTATCAWTSLAERWSLRTEPWIELAGLAKKNSLHAGDFVHHHRIERYP